MKYYDQKREGAAFSFLRLYPALFAELKKSSFMTRAIITFDEISIRRAKH